eukprot:g60269.t1
MGVPSFFRWLISKYPKVITDAKSVKPDVINGVEVPVDQTQPNPMGWEFDNLYLDMNGIIHPCCHPEGKPQPTSEDEMIANVFEYIDHIFSLVRPRNLLYMAIDGVAPRAKMNQQRARRFKAAKEAKELMALKQKLRAEYRAKGQEVPEPQEGWDSNVITPGTPFMARLSDALHFYIKSRIHSNPAWRNIKVIFSDAKVPGEGEHKIMAFIRLQRAQPGYNPNQWHCLYGMDADLIMLGLASHEPKFAIIREKIDFENRDCNICGSQNHQAYECNGEGVLQDQAGEHNKKERTSVAGDFQYLQLNVLREYLEHDLTPSEALPFGWDLERAIDDFVFMCFFVGNDFLPHLPSLELRDGGIDFLVDIWKALLPKLGGYMTFSGGKINLHRVVQILEILGNCEDNIFKHRHKEHRRQLQREAQRAAQKRQRAQEWARQGKESMSAPAPANFSIHVKMESFKQSQLPGSEDEVKLGEEGWRSRYFMSKMKLDVDKPEAQATIDMLHQSYAEGLAWVMFYYYQGCVSWDWYFPFHYAPFASGLREINKFQDKIKFKLSAPFRPLSQLMGVLPSKSRHCLPHACQQLMTSSASKIIDFYPTDFGQDLNGKRYSWQAVVLLPFIDETRLLQALKEVEHTFSPEVQERNAMGQDYIFLHSSHPAATTIEALHDPDEIARCLELRKELVAAFQIKVDRPTETDIALSKEEGSAGPQTPSAAATASQTQPSPPAAAGSKAQANLTAAQRIRANLQKRKSEGEAGEPGPAKQLKTEFMECVEKEGGAVKQETEHTGAVKEEAEDTGAVKQEARTDSAAEGSSALTVKEDEAQPSQPSQHSKPAAHNKTRLPLDPEEAAVFGAVSTYEGNARPGQTLRCVLESEQPVHGALVFSAIFHNPPFKPHQSKLLPGVTLPKKTLISEADFMPEGRYRHYSTRHGGNGMMLPPHLQKPGMHGMRRQSSSGNSMGSDFSGYSMGSPRPLLGPYGSPGGAAFGRAGPALSPLAMPPYGAMPPPPSYGAQLSPSPRPNVYYAQQSPYYGGQQSPSPGPAYGHQRDERNRYAPASPTSPYQYRADSGGYSQSSSSYHRPDPSPSFERSGNQSYRPGGGYGGGAREDASGLSKAQQLLQQARMLTGNAPSSSYAGGSSYQGSSGSYPSGSSSYPSGSGSYQGGSSSYSRGGSYGGSSYSPSPSPSYGAPRMPCAPPRMTSSPSPRLPATPSAYNQNRYQRY